MRVNAGIIILISFLFLVGTVGAVGIPDKVTISSDKSYVVAGSGEEATITAIVSNTTTAPGPVDGAKVQFIVLDPTLGTFTPLTATTDINGRATSLFNVNKTSGIADIRVNVLDTNVFSTTTQKIDHNKAYSAKFSHPLEGEVNTTVRVNISFTDYYGNPIDQLINTNQTHTISLHVYGPSPDDCNFVGYGHAILNQVLDPNGNVSVQVKLTSAAGPNSVTMDQFELIPPPSQRIITAISSDVSSIKSFFNPESPPGVPADGMSNFTITYILYDQYRNPAGQQELWVNTSVGESTKFKTDNLGQIVIAYGEKIVAGTITINATSVTKPFVNSSDKVEFTSTAATTIVLMANPEIMVSRDKNTLANSTITAKITNIMGGASPNENVTFSLGAEQYPGGPYNVTNRSSFSKTSVVTTTTAKTDANGDATVVFYPGAFNTLPTALYYSQTATGQVMITATWTDTAGTTFTKDIQVKWKNYPYLSAKTSVNPTTIKVNETVDVTILLTADGWALQHKPIDVVLAIDKSGSMDNYNVGGITRMQAAKNAAISFVNNPNMTDGFDRIGLVSYDQEATVGTDASLGSSFSTVKTKINAIDSNNGPTAMRQGFKQSIDHMIANPKPTAVRAIILMTDGNWNQGGSPLAVGKGYDLGTWVMNNRDSGVSSPYYGFSPYSTDFEDQDYRWYSGLGGALSSSSTTVVKKPRQIDPDTGADTSGRTTETRGTSGSYCANGQFTWQNMSVYAKENNIRLYTLSFASNIAPDEAKALAVLANSTGGFYRHAPDQATLIQVYADIAGDLQKDIAGVDTAMTVDLKDVNVTGVTVPGAEVFDYVYAYPVSTSIRWQNSSNTSTTVIDQSANWVTNNHKLNFTVGTMKVGDTWQATFRLKVKKSGSIDIFGPDSALIFNNSGTIETLTLPRTFLTVTPDISTVFEQQQIDVVGFCAASTTANLPVSWITTYTGGPADIFEEVSYIDETGAHIPFYHGSYHVTTSTSATRTTTFNLNSVPQGQHYDIEVRTYTADDNAIDSSEACSGVVYNTAGKMFIKLD